jgi:hypothetical protein
MAELLSLRAAEPHESDFTLDELTLDKTYNSGYFAQILALARGEEITCKHRSLLVLLMSICEELRNDEFYIAIEGHLGKNNRRMSNLHSATMLCVKWRARTRRGNSRSLRRIFMSCRRHDSTTSRPRHSTDIGVPVDENHGR